MSHRERVLAALEHTEPDRVPIDLGGCLASTIISAAYERLRAELGLPAAAGHESLHFASTAEIDEDVRQALDLDIIHAPRSFGTADDIQILSEDRIIDEWGVQWHKPDQGHYYVENAPFGATSDVAAVEAYEWPEATRMVRTEGLREAVETLRRETDYAISLEVRGRVMSIGQFLCGFEKWMMDLALNPSFVGALLERTTEIQVQVNDILLSEVGDLVDIVYTSDDLGGQHGALLSPSCFQSLLKAHFGRMWEHLRGASPAKLMHHCCGSAVPFIGDFIELGVEVLNPVQVSAAGMDPARLKAEFGKNLTFWGGVDTRDVMPRGSVADVRNEVARRIRQMAPGGGFILAAVHNIQAEVPPANICALFRAGRELGRYPLDVA